MQVSKALVVLACLLLLSGAEMCVGAGAAAVPRAMLGASSTVVPAAHAAGAMLRDNYCCRPGPSCCPSDGTPASDDSP
ncbi:unnamed protein product [Urochloa decumbens]|uniref:Uncharacterized protein n=1 Tax=Urochloa decumbens TaxID=240449 RepID=A0ABC9EF31_9POAL